MWKYRKKPSWLCYRWMKKNKQDAPKAVYIHIPFCAKRCHYCDFTTYVLDGQPVDDYLDALVEEMKRITHQIAPTEMHSIFIGGGTPTVLTPKQMQRLLTGIHACFPVWSKEIEFTVEANPGTVHEELLRVMKAGGVNRLSMGAQSFQTSILAEIGRDHGVHEIVESVELARKVGLDNLSLDLMFGLPNQSLQDVKDSLEEVFYLQPKHLSCYSLKIEKGTRFDYLYQRDQLPLPSDDEEYEMYQWIRAACKDKGLVQYEISNFAFPGKESRHNMTYWRNEPYYGVGVGAHGYLNSFRYANEKKIADYIDQVNQGRLPIAESHEVSLTEAMENEMILGLRLQEGVSKQRFQERFDSSVEKAFGNQLNQLLADEMIQIDGDMITLTEKGILFGNDVFAAFL